MNTLSRRAVLCFGLVSIVCLWTGSIQADETVSGLRFEKEYLNLGRIETVEDIIRNFPFVVRGNGPLEILDIRASCGCIQPSLSKRLYQPGERDSLKFGIHSPSQNQGKKRYEVSVTYRQQSQVRTVTLLIDLELFKPIIVEPSTLLLYVNGNNEIHHRLTITDQRAMPLDLEQIVSSSSRIQPKVVNAEKVDPAVKQVDLEIEGDFPIGKTEERLVIRTKDARHPELVVPVTIVRSSRIRVLPEVLHGKLASKSRQMMWNVLLNDSQGEPIRIKSILTNAPGVNVEYPTELTTRSRIRVIVTPGENPVPIDSELVIHVVEPLETDIHLPLQLDE